MELKNRASVYAGVDRSDEKFDTYFYLALRYMDCPIVQAVNTINTLKLTNIKYEYLFLTDPQSVLGIFTGGVKNKEQKIKDFIAKKKLPVDGYMQNITIIETILENPSGPTDFIKTTEQVIGQLRLVHSEITDTTIENFIGE